MGFWQSWILWPPEARPLRVCSQHAHGTCIPCPQSAPKPRNLYRVQTCWHCSSFLYEDPASQQCSLLWAILHPPEKNSCMKSCTHSCFTLHCWYQSWCCVFLLIKHITAVLQYFCLCSSNKHCLRIWIGYEIHLKRLYAVWFLLDSLNNVWRGRRNNTSTPIYLWLSVICFLFCDVLLDVWPDIEQHARICLLQTH